MVDKQQLAAMVMATFTLELNMLGVAGKPPEPRCVLSCLRNGLVGVMMKRLCLQSAGLMPSIVQEFAMNNLIAMPL